MQINDARHAFNAFRLLIASCVLLSGGAQAAPAAEELDDLRRRIEQQDELISEQADALAEQQGRAERQQQELESLREQVESLESGPDAAATAAAETTGENDAAEGNEPDATGRAGGPRRDAVADLNRAAVEAGEFPGSIRIPGPWKTSLEIGGFVRVLAISDSDAENIGEALLPAILGTRRDDDDGRFSIDATLTRLLIDARAPTRFGQVRGYVEWDLNGSNDGDLDIRYRHAYGSFETEYGTLLVGQTWTTAMDVKIIPEALPEPTFSGTIFQRQTMVRWTQPVGSSFFIHVAAEDPSSDDVFADDPDPNFFNTKYPDGVLGLEYIHGDRGHVRLNSLVRYLEVDLPAGGGTADKTGWGLMLSSSIRVFEQDLVTFGGTYGKGVGRYLLGIPATAGARIKPAEDSLELNENWGAFLGYKHYWLDHLRSTAYGGYAKAEQSGTEPGAAFKSSLYGAANLIWSPFPFLSVGLEYIYARRENRFGPDIGNHRVLVGFQVF